MSVVRLVMLDGDEAVSGLVPSPSIDSILSAIARGATNIATFWPLVAEIDSGLREHFESNLDPSPLLEGTGDGLLVISWEHNCIESFQEYQPVRAEGTARRHNGLHAVDAEAEQRYAIGPQWHIIDHHFEESRH